MVAFKNFVILTLIRVGEGFRRRDVCGVVSQGMKSEALVYISHFFLFAPVTDFGYKR